MQQRHSNWTQSWTARAAHQPTESAALRARIFAALSAHPEALAAVRRAFDEQPDPRS